MRLAAGRGWGRQLAYAGWVRREELPDYFAAADVALYPFDDTLINRTKCAVKLLDLLSAGVPVVAEAVGQNQEYIRQEQTGLLVPPGETEWFAASVVRLLGDEALRQRLGRAAHEDLKARYTWDQLALVAEGAYTR